MPFKDKKKQLEYKTKWRKDNPSKARQYNRNAQRKYQKKYRKALRAKNRGLSVEEYIAQKTVRKEAIERLRAAGISNPSHVYRRELKRQIIRAYKSNHPCPCGESNIAALDFHHRDPSQKEGVLSDAEKWSIKKIEAEIAKCDVLCKNCHAKLHWAERESEVAKLDLLIKGGPKVSQRPDTIRHLV